MAASAAWEMTMKIKQTGKELLEEMRAVARGDRLAPPRPAAQTLSALTTEALALLSTMAEPLIEAEANEERQRLNRANVDVEARA